jgi:hypothetical protein
LDDPRAGYFGMAFVDYSVPIGEPMVRLFIHRHRLEKKDPACGRQRTRETDRILGGSGRARRCAPGVDRRSQLVEPGFRSGGIQERISR